MIGISAIAPDELIVDNFAGGGGASTGIELALGRPIDIAINHDPEAIAMHAINHPETLHLCDSVWKVDIVKVVAGRKVGLAWFSPDCKHFSKAKGGKPVNKKIRGLAWVALRWAGLVRPRVIDLENVEEFQTWGPVVNGQPDPARKGKTFKRWVAQLRNLGYVVDWRELRACDYGAPTIRKRLFIQARCDGQPIEWPEPTHAAGGNSFLQPYRTAAECIDWSIPCPSIFLTKEEGRAIGVNRPLAAATMSRIARGVKRYVLDASKPFIVNLTHHGSDRNESLNEPMRTVTGARRGEKALVVPYLAGLGGRMGQSPERSVEDPYHTITAKADTALITPFLSAFYGDKRPGDVRGAVLGEPLRTQPTENRHALVVPHITRFNENGIGHGLEEPFDTVMAGAPRFGLCSAFLAQHNAGPHNDGLTGRSAEEPLSTTTASGSQQALVASSLVKLRGTCKDGQPIDEPMATVSAGGTHIGEVRAFLMAYFATDQDLHLDEPLHTVTTKHRFGLVTVQGVDYMIVDIGMRMLSPRELFRAQGFPDSYIIDRGIDPQTGSEVKLTKTAQVRMCGNSVSPYPAAALIRAQFGTERARAVA